MSILTVYTKLLDQTLEGARIIDMGSTKTCQCFVLPYDSINKVKDYLVNKYAFYILLGEKPIKRRTAYIGQTYDFTCRVIDHKQNKDWWDTALVFVSKADEIFASEVQYLEYLGWKEAKSCEQYYLDNTKSINEPRLPEDKKNDMELFFEEIKFLTRFYGCSLFDKPVKNPGKEWGVFERFYLDVKKRNISASILYFPMDKTFYMEDGSTISATDTSSSHAVQELRDTLLDSEYCRLEDGVIRIIGGTNIPVKNGSPSMVAELVTGTSMQGPKALKNKDGKTFAELYSDK